MATKLLQLMQGQIDGLVETSKIVSTIPQVRNMYQAKGYWLDMLNELIGGTIRPKGTYSDTELRIRMEKKIFMNNGAGTLESIDTAVRYYLYLDNDNTWQSIEDKDVNIYSSKNYVIIEASGENIKSLDKIKEIQNYIAVGYGILIVETFDDDTFRISDEDGNEVDINTRTGLSDIFNPTIGGKLASLISPVE